MDQQHKNLPPMLRKLYGRTRGAAVTTEEATEGREATEATTIAGQGSTGPGDTEDAAGRGAPMPEGHLTGTSKYPSVFRRGGVEVSEDAIVLEAWQRSGMTETEWNRQPAAERLERFEAVLFELHPEE